MSKFKRSAASLLAASMLVGLTPAVSFAEDTTAAQGVKVQATEVKDAPSRLKTDSVLLQQGTASLYQQDQQVNVIVEFEEAPVMSYYDSAVYAVGGATPGEAVASFLATEDAKSLEAELKETQRSYLGQIAEAIAQVNGAGPMKVNADAVKVLGQWSTLTNAMAIEAPYGAIEAIKALDGVKNAYVEHVFDAPEPIEEEQREPAAYDYSNWMVEADYAWKKGYTGKGMVVAVLDTGLDVVSDETTGEISRTHEAFRGNSFMSGDPMDSENGWKLRYTQDDINALDKSQLNANSENVFKNNKVPYAYDYADGDSNVEAAGSNHGVHVSGTVAGYATTAEGEEVFCGVAPDAQLMMMKVFPSAGGGAPERVTVSALEDAIKLGADVVNLSLGSDNGFSDDNTIQWQAFARIKKAGVMAMVAAGNASDSDEGNNYGGEALAEHPDVSMISRPAVFEGALSVASMENDVAVYSILNWDGNQIHYVESKGETVLRDTIDNEANYMVFPAGLGKPEDYENIGWENQKCIALVKRGEITFSEKIANAMQYQYTNEETGEKTGIMGVIVYDSDPNGTTYVNMAVDAGITMPAIFINGQDGAAMAESLASGKEVEVNLPKEDVLVDNESAGQMSTFSSWGSTPSLKLKPEITAPGGKIWSAVPGAVTEGEEYTGSYEVMSGTSMATPHMAGVSALVRQRVRNDFPGLSAEEEAKLANQLMVSTAGPVRDPNGMFYSPRLQGAGLVSAYEAVRTPAYITVEGQDVGKLELGDDVNRNGQYPINFTVHNTKDKELTYNVILTLMRPDTDMAVGTYRVLDNDVLVGVSGQNDVGEGVINLGSITVPAGGEASFSQLVSLTDAAKAELDQKFPNGIFVEGFVTLNAVDSSVPQLGLPLLAYYGDWTEAPIFDGYGASWIDEPQDGENVYNNETTWGVSSMGSCVVDWESGKILGSLTLGQNPYGDRQTVYKADNITLSPNGDEYFDRIDAPELYQLRDAKMMSVKVVDFEDRDKVYFQDYETIIKRTAMNSDYNAPVPVTALHYGMLPIWNGEVPVVDENGEPVLDENGEPVMEALPSGTKCLYIVDAYGDGDYGAKIANPDFDSYPVEQVDDYEAILNGSYTPTFNGHEMNHTGDNIAFPVTVDTEGPEILDGSVEFVQKDGKTYMNFTVVDDGAVAAVEVASLNGEEIYMTDVIYDEGVQQEYYEVEVNPNVESLSVFLGDYGANEHTYKVNMPAPAPTTAPTATPTAKPQQGNDVEDFVERLYEVCLDRASDAAGKADWVGKLKSGSITGTEAASGFVFSKEFQNKNFCNEDYVKQLYRAFMGREADLAGLKDWVSRMESGLKREEVFNGFAQSKEFAQLCQQYNIKVGDPIKVPEYGTVAHGECPVCGSMDGVTAFVTRLYDVCLDRAPDAAGLNDWTEQLWNHTKTGRDVAYGFVFSKEFTGKNYDDAAYVEYLYEAFFDRASDKEGKADWLKRMEQGWTREQVFEGFVGSEEFGKLCTYYGIARD